MSIVSNGSKHISQKTTPLSVYIQKRLMHLDMTWADLMRASKMPKTNSTRLRRKGWIPSTEECTRLAAALGAPWEDIWIAAGHLKAEQIESIRGNIQSYSYLWRLTPEEASIIGAYRACLQDSRQVVLAAVRGVARASLHEFHDSIKTETRRTEIVLDFVNGPDYIHKLYGDTTSPMNKDLLRQDPEIDMTHLSYAQQAAIVGVLRYVSTGLMSPMTHTHMESNTVLPIIEEVENYQALRQKEAETNSRAIQEKWASTSD